MHNSAIVAHTMDDAKKIFDDKVKYAWDRLPSWLKQEWEIDTSNVKMLKFRRGSDESYIYVGTGLRGGTNQNLLISELSTLDQRYPEKANEIITGALNTVHKGQIIVIESTSKGAFGQYYKLCKLAMQKMRDKVKLTAMDWKFHFFSWIDEPGYNLSGDVFINREENDYFKEIEDKTKHTLTQEQKMWYIKKKETLGEKMFSEYPTIPEEAFKSATEGTYYTKIINKLFDKKQITLVPYDPRMLVHTFWDLGVGDAMTIGFVQFSQFEVRIIDYYENSGEGMPHYINVLKEKEYNYGTHNAPHDIEARELSTGVSRLETAQKLGIIFQVVPNIGKEDGIDATRNMLPRCWIDKDNCKRLVEGLSEYRKKWNEPLGTFSNEPLHDWASHIADMVRYIAVGMTQILPNSIGTEPLEDPEVLEERRRHQEQNFDPFNIHIY